MFNDYFIWNLFENICLKCFYVDSLIFYCLWIEVEFTVFPVELLENGFEVFLYGLFHILPLLAISSVWSCQALISSGDDRLLTFWSLITELSCLTPIAAQYEMFFDVSIRNAENTQKGGQKGHFETFSDPWLA